MTRKKRIGALAIVLISIMAIAATYAFFTAEDTADNVFVLGNLGIDLYEPGWTEPPPGSLVPGATLPKDPTATARYGSVDGYLRFVVEFRDMDSSGNVAGLITDAGRIELIRDTMWFDASYVDENSPGTNIIKGESYTLSELNAMSGVYNPVDMIRSNARFEECAVWSSDVPGRLIFNYIHNSGMFRAGDSVVLFTHAVIPTCYGNADIAALHGTNGYAVVVSAQAIQASGFDNALDAFKELHETKYSP